MDHWLTSPQPLVEAAGNAIGNPEVLGADSSGDVGPQRPVDLAAGGDGAGVWEAPVPVPRAGHLPAAVLHAADGRAAVSRRLRLPHPRAIPGQPRGALPRAVRARHRPAPPAARSAGR